VLPGEIWKLERFYLDTGSGELLPKYVRKKGQGMATPTVVLERELFIDVLDCAARAEDTTVRQSRDMLDVLNRLR
jgi:hypothetical protein